MGPSEKHPLGKVRATPRITQEKEMSQTGKAKPLIKGNLQQFDAMGMQTSHLQRQAPLGSIPPGGWPQRGAGRILQGQKNPSLSHWGNFLWEIAAGAVGWTQAADLQNATSSFSSFLLSYRLLRSGANADTRTKQEAQKFNQARWPHHDGTGGIRAAASALE